MSLAASSLRAGFGVILVCLASCALAEERQQSFDKDPGWDAHNNRTTKVAERTIKQDFGYSATNHAGGKAAGELGGFISPAAEPAYYAKKITARSFDDPLTASGTFACTGRPVHILLGFFNADTLNEWRTPNTIALRLSGRGDVFYAWLEYCSQNWRAGGDHPQSFPTVKDSKTGRTALKGFAAKGAVHKWSLTYDPRGNKGSGSVTATIDDQTAVCDLVPEHRADRATFNRFGVLTVMKHGDTGGELWLDDVSINGETEDFTNDPGWDARNNRSNYASRDVRPRFDFGYSQTQHGGGKASGEMGGLIFRGDCRFPDKLAYYGDRLERLTLAKPLRGSGKVSLRRGVTDSTILIGFFHAKDSMEVNPSQASGIPRSFLGVAVEGPSREGFQFYPIYRVRGDEQGHGQKGAPHIYPDGKPHNWTLEYDPKAGDGRGQITATLDGKAASVKLKPGQREIGAQFDRFGIITTWIDGNGQWVYFDDLTYTFRQE